MDYMPIITAKAVSNPNWVFSLPWQSETCELVVFERYGVTVAAQRRWYVPESYLPMQLWMEGTAAPGLVF